MNGGRFRRSEHPPHASVALRRAASPPTGNPTPEIVRFARSPPQEERQVRLEAIAIRAFPAGRRAGCPEFASLPGLSRAKREKAGARPSLSCTGIALPFASNPAAPRSAVRRDRATRREHAARCESEPMAKRKAPPPARRMNPPRKVGARSTLPGFRINGRESPFHGRS